MSAAEGADVGGGVMGDGPRADRHDRSGLGHLPSFAREEALPAF
jgi:hypothetical protein